jgi:hypothetical protein
MPKAWGSWAKLLVVWEGFFPAGLVAKSGAKGKEQLFWFFFGRPQKNRKIGQKNCFAPTQIAPLPSLALQNIIKNILRQILAVKRNAKG